MRFTTLNNRSLASVDRVLVSPPFVYRESQLTFLVQGTCLGASFSFDFQKVHIQVPILKLLIWINEEAVLPPKLHVGILHIVLLFSVVKSMVKCAALGGFSGYGCKGIIPVSSENWQVIQDWFTEKAVPKFLMRGLLGSNWGSSLSWSVTEKNAALAKLLWISHNVTIMSQPTDYLLNEV